MALRPHRRLVWLIGVLATGCAALDTDRTAPGSDTGTERVMLSVTHRSEWRVLWVEGDTDLPDGAVVNFRVTHALAQTTPADEWPAPNLIATGRATVRDGQYWTRINTINWPDGGVEVEVQFPLPPQPPEVVQRYGEFGEHLTGDNVTDLGGVKAVQVTHVLEHER